jgi:hypothetical protein
MRLNLRFLIFFINSLFFVLAGCPEFTEVKPLGSVRIYLDGTEQGSFVTIQKGQTLILKALADGSDTGEVSIVWEINGNDAAIISSGTGAECIIRGENINTTGSVSITAKAWRPGTDRERTKTISIFVTQADTASGIGEITGRPQINVNEVQVLIAELIPVWASGNITWSQNPQDMVELLPSENTRSCTVKGLKAGDVIITATAGDFSKSFNMQITPDMQGNPVTGLRIKYAQTSDRLPVSNIIWLYPNDTVMLEAEWTGGMPDTITWTVDNPNEVTAGTGATHTGYTCILTGVSESDFNSPPAVVRVTAFNNDNASPVTAAVFVKTQAKPVWAWDRARDGGVRNGDVLLSSGSTMAAEAGVTGLTITGRGEYPEAVPVKVGGSPNFITYNNMGLLINSTNPASGSPVPAPNPNNSTRIWIGSNRAPSTNPMTVICFNNNTTPDNTVFCVNCTGLGIIEDPAKIRCGHQEGIFDFLEIGGFIRVSVDYEIIWSAGASRDMWIMVNNNNANAAQSILGTASQLLVEPLTAARGTRATAVTTLDVRDLAERNVRGLETLETAFITIIALSNGGSVNVSGIRIEREN